MERVIRHKSTAFILYYMNVCAYLTTLLVNFNNIHEIFNSVT